jgi:two-component system, LytTR family, sensor histidine kinase AgrC
MLYTFLNTFLYLYVAYEYLDKKVKFTPKSILVIACVVAIKPIGMVLLKDTFSVFIFVWCCIFIMLNALTGRNFKRNFELAFFVELINLMAYFMAAGIALTINPSLKTEDIMNFNILTQGQSAVYIACNASFLIGFGVLRRFIPIDFSDEGSRGRNISAIYLIIGINVLLKVINDYRPSYGIELIIYVSINLFILIFYVANRKMDMEKLKAGLELEEKRKRIEELTLYTETVEGLVSKYKEFEHDIKNMMIGSSSVNLDANELYGKLKEEIVGKKSYDAFFYIKDIKYEPLKFILSHYAMICIKKDIEMDLITLGEIAAADISEVDFSRIMGIIMDNAVEEVEQNERKKIEVFAEQMEGSLNITVGNTFREELLDLGRISEKGFSTKGEGRGLGLSIVKSIVGSRDNLKLNTFVNGDMFIQDLFIMKNAIDIETG